MPRFKATKANAKPDCGPINAAPLSAEEASTLAALLHSLADKTRVAIVSAVLHAPGGELHGRALREQLGLRQPTASHHLGKLVAAGILDREKRGPYAYYRVDPGAFARLRSIFSEAGEGVPVPGAVRRLSTTG